MMIEYGNTIVGEDWEINEMSPIAYSRVYYVHGGEVVYRDSYGKTELRPNYLYIFPSTNPYSMRQNAERPLNCTFLHLDLFPSYVTKMIAIDVSRNNLLRSILETISRAIEDGNVKIIMSLAYAFEKYCFEKEILSPPDRIIAKAIDYIAKNISEDISVEDIGRCCGYNKEYFIKLFKKKVGITPYQYVINYRLKESLRLLAEDVGVAETACNVGFLDSKAYCRAFRDKFGISPNKYRRNFVVIP